MVEQKLRPSPVDTPFAEAHVTIIEGAQGEGKSVTGVARVVDAYHLDCVRVFCEEHHIICRVKAYDPKTRIARIRHNGMIKLFKIPESYKLHSPMRIFCNFHLYGIPYVFCPSFDFVMKGLQSGLISGGWLVVDEYYVGGNARECMTALGRELNKQSWQFRKMQLQVLIMTPMAKLIDWTMRLIPTEHISCSYDKKTGNVTLTIRKRGQKGNREITYNSLPYRKYYWTNERISA